MADHRYYQTNWILDRKVPTFYWSCCDARSTRLFRSKEHARLDWYRTHVMPGVTEPDHTPTVEVDALGGVSWECACGARSRAQGYRQESRARQGHTRHTQSALITWYQTELVDQQGREGEIARIMQRWDGFTDKGREVYGEKLKELLI